MSTPKTVTRRHILSAIRTENLTPGEWIDFDYPNREKPQLGCPVCAVGAVLRRAGFNGESIDDYGNALIDAGRVSPYNIDAAGAQTAIDTHLAKGRYMNALSLKYESLATQFKTKPTVRKHLAAWVKANLPTVVKL